MAKGQIQISAHASPFGRAGMRPVPAVTEFGLLAQEALQGRSTGRVVAVFESSFYAVLGGRWICIGLPYLGSGPLHVLCESRPLRWPTVGDTAAAAGSIFYTDNKPFATFEAAATWAPERAPRWTLNSLRTGLGAVDEFWQVGPAEQGLAAAGAHVPLRAKPSPMIEAATPGLVALNGIVGDALEGRAPLPADCAELTRLIGLGPGLTPSGDDVLAGALVALAALGLLGARDMLWNVCREHLARTNDISRAHLRTAALGYGAAALHAAIHTTIGGRADRVERAIAAVSAIGHSSGRDGFAGALIVLRAVERHLAGARQRVQVSSRI
jgi:hypothetical protein